MIVFRLAYLYTTVNIGELYNVVVKIIEIDSISTYPNIK